MAESGPGGIYIFDDFISEEIPIAGSLASTEFGPFRAVGQGIADNDSGIISLETDGLNGIAQLLSPNASDNDSTGLTTATMFDAGLMGTIVGELRVRFADLDTKELFFGFSDLNSDVHSLEGVLIHGASTTITLTASDLCGFLFSSELSDDEDWHMVYNGGTAAGETVSTAIDADADAIAGEFQVLRVEIDANGDARWFIDGDLKQSIAGAVSTSTDLAGQVVLEEKGTGSNETVDLDYMMFKANRDWTV